MAMVQQRNAVAMVRHLHTLNIRPDGNGLCRRMLQDHNSRMTCVNASVHNMCI